jgi:hypothetical protein
VYVELHIILIVTRNARVLLFTDLPTFIPVFIDEGSTLPPGSAHTFALIEYCTDNELGAHVTFKNHLISFCGCLASFAYSDLHTTNVAIENVSHVCIL